MLYLLSLNPTFQVVWIHGVREAGVVVRLNAVCCCCGSTAGRTVTAAISEADKTGKSRRQWISSCSPYSFSQPAGAHSSESSYVHLCVVLAQAGTFVVMGLQHGGTWHSIGPQQSFISS